MSESPQHDAPAPVTITISALYRISDRITILKSWRAFVSGVERQVGKKLSDARAHALMEDHFASQDFLTSVDGSPATRNSFESLVCAKTIGNMRKRPLDFSTSSIQHDTILYLDAFMKLVAQKPIEYL